MSNQAHQFNYEMGDLDKDLPGSVDHKVAILAALLAIENEHPGTLVHVLRIAALVNYDFRLICKNGNPQKSLEAQKDLIEWIQWWESLPTSDQE